MAVYTCPSLRTSLVNRFNARSRARYAVTPARCAVSRPLTHLREMHHASGKVVQLSRTISLHMCVRCVRCKFPIQIGSIHRLYVRLYQMRPILPPVTRRSPFLRTFAQEASGYETFSISSHVCARCVLFRAFPTPNCKPSLHTFMQDASAPCHALNQWSDSRLYARLCKTRLRRANRETSGLFRLYARLCKTRL